MVLLDADNLPFPDSRHRCAGRSVCGQVFASPELIEYSQLRFLPSGIYGGVV